MLPKIVRVVVLVLALVLEFLKILICDYENADDDEDDKEKTTMPLKWIARELHMVAWTLRLAQLHAPTD